MNRKLISALSQNGGVWEEVLDSLPGSVTIVDKEGHLMYMNSYGENLYQVGKDQYLGRHCLDNAQQIMSPRMEGLVTNLIKDGTPHKTISKLELKDDQLFTSVSIGVPLSNEDGYVLVSIPSKEISADKQELKRLTTKLEEHSKFLESLINSSPNAIFATTLDGDIELTNRKAEVLFGFSDQELIGMNVISVFSDSSINATHRGPFSEESHEASCVNKAGLSFPARLQVSDVEDADGNLRGKLYIITDITKEKALETKLALSEKLAIYSELMAGIFHQINNPLVGVVNFSSVLLEKMDPADSNRNLVSTIFDAGKKCQKLITTMMRCIREPESTFGRFEASEVLAAALREAVTEEGERAEQVTIKTNISEGLPLVNGDALQIHQVVRNLVVNALQAMPDGGVLEIGAEVDLCENFLRVEVADSGVGISEENLDKVFTPFFTTKKYTGGGLGLSFAFQVVKAHLGRIDVESKVGAGTKFKVFLPVSNSGGQE
jgi:PAS domain S-box-containing protein